MKRKFSLLLVLLMALGVVMTSCSKDEDDEVIPTTNVPEISFPAGAEKILEGPLPDSIEIAIRIKAVEDLKKLEIIKVVGGTETPIGTVESFSSKSDVTIYPLIKIQGEDFPLTIKFRLTDKKDNSIAATFIIKLKEVPQGGEINKFSAKLLGAQGNTVSGFFNSTNGDTYTYANAKAASASMDLCYAYPTSVHVNYVNYNATLVAPSDAMCAVVINSEMGTTAWATKNATTIHKITLTNDEFASINNDLIITDKYVETTTTNVNNLVVGDFLAFKTAGGKKGIIKVTAITAGNDGSITIDVKVQK